MNPKNAPPLIGLDVGTSRIVAAKEDGGEFQFSSELNAFVSVPHTRMTQTALEREGVGFSVHGQEIFVLGNMGARLAGLLNTETRRPMRHGVLNAGELESATVVRRLVEDLTGCAADPKPRVCFTVPAPPLAGDDALTYHEATLREIISGHDCEVRSIIEGLAVVYSELEDTNYTGIGISCGGGLCNVTLAWLSMPLISFSIPKAGDFIDASAASVTGDLANRVRIAKEEMFHFNGHYTGKLHQVLTVYYDDLIQSLLASMKEVFSNSRKLPRMSKPVPIVLSGGTATPEGFLNRFDKSLRSMEFPVEISEVRLAANPITAAARGALVAAMAEMN